MSNIQGKKLTGNLFKSVINFYKVLHKSSIDEKIE